MNRGLPIAALLIALLCTAPAQAATVDPLQLVRSTTTQVLEKIALQREVLKQDPGLVYETVNQLVLPRFDFDYMSRLVLGKYWLRASEAQREEFIVEFRELLVRTYATTLLNYSDQSITYLPLRESDKATEVTVNTRISGGGAPAIPIDYSLYLSGGEWKVFDVAIDNVSLVSQYRRSYANHIKRYQIDGLLERMRMLNTRNRE
ncbi:MAG: ABC transporter substrate-binding protein [Gammaproteobacteria bacterium]|nr:ABC transporter substrate-binding protein [Gammaproteobacteria bacterium]